MTIAISFTGLLLDLGASGGFGVVSNFFPLIYLRSISFGIKVVSGIYIPIIKKGICAVATD